MSKKNIFFALSCIFELAAVILFLITGILSDLCAILFVIGALFCLLYRREYHRENNQSIEHITGMVDERLKEVKKKKNL